MMTLERQVADDPYAFPYTLDNVSLIRELYPSPPQLKRCESVHMNTIIAPLLKFQEYDFSWWEQDEEDWDVYDYGDDDSESDNTSVPEDAYDHLTEEEYEEYLLDRNERLL